MIYPQLNAKKKYSVKMINKIISTICCTLKVFLKQTNKVWGYRNEQRRIQKMDKIRGWDTNLRQGVNTAKKHSMGQRML